jgi:anti-sigma B factor antagonist
MDSITGHGLPTSIRVLPNGSTTIVTMIGDHDLSSAPVLRASIERELAEGRACVIDLRGATFLDSAILSVLLDASRRSREAGLELPVVLNGNRGSAVRRLVKATMVTLRTFDDLADATAAAGTARAPALV